MHAFPLPRRLYARALLAGPAQRIPYPLRHKHGPSRVHVSKLDAIPLLDFGRRGSQILRVLGEQRKRRDRSAVTAYCATPTGRFR